jgi:Fur family ferric uptake transcriptional regulator
MRLTKNRQEILDILEESEEALSASEIHSSLPNINLVTIYRNLDYFVNTGLVKKLNLTSQESVFEVQHEPHHHAICSICNKVIHFETANKKLMKEFSLPDFTINDLEITLRGTCKEHHLEQNKRTETK